jgi:hypothetical protein
MAQSDDNIIKGEFHCPLCGGLLIEKKPKLDTRLVRNKELTVRLLCQCGFYEDKVVNPDDFLH